MPISDLLKALNMSETELYDGFVVATVSAALAYTGAGLDFSSARMVFLVTFMGVIIARFINSQFTLSSIRREPLF